MVHRPFIDTELCFVLMPFRDPFNGYYEKIIKPTIAEARMRPLRADEVYGTRAIIRDVWDSIWRAAVIVADVTDRNPNVNYELGLCHALGVPTILLTKREEDVPFDYRHRRYIRYNTDEAGWEARLRQDLLNTLNAARVRNIEEELPWPYETTHGNTTDAVFSTSLQVPDARALIVQGVRRVRDVIVRAFGPHGGAIAGRDAGAVPLRRGFAIADAITATNPLEQRGIAEMQQIAREQFAAIGDGTKTAMLLAAKLIEDGDHAFREGHSMAGVLVGMRDAIETALAMLESTKKKVADRDFAHVAVTAGGKSDGIYGAADAVRRFGNESYIGIEDAEGAETTLNVWEGLRVDAGYASEYFVTDPQTKEAVLENCLVLLTDHRLASMRDLLPILEAVTRRGRPLLIFSAEVEGEALATLVTNKLRGTITCAAVNLPQRGREDLITDIAIYCGASAVMQALGTRISAVELQDLGEAKRIEVDQYMTRIVGGCGRPELLAAHLKSLRTQIAASLDERIRAQLRERLLRLSANMAVLAIGGRTRLEANELKSRAEAALASCRAAAESGIVAGGGAWLLAAAGAVLGQSARDVAVRTGYQIVAEALEQPIRTIIQSSNAGREIIDTLRKAPLTTVFDAARGAVVPLSDAPIFDAARMLQHAIEIANAHATAILETVSWDNVLVQSS